MCPVFMELNEGNRTISQLHHFILVIYHRDGGMGWGVARLREVGRSFKGLGVARLKGGGWFV